MLALAPFHLFPDPVADPVLDFRQLNFACEQHRQFFKPPCHVNTFQQFLALFGVDK
ncbi:MAG: hypothetical protein BWX80_03016 [Candidatus Hydrogenedentes bacterium ADurb.Bin101]|nr:MAG: hypothetical protein BWX80_03016 [Candidatus Hydrogenedentes bacterium ADurb.Bin101]